MKMKRMAHFLPCAAMLTLTALTANAQDPFATAPLAQNRTNPPLAAAGQPPAVWRTASPARYGVPLAPGVAKKTAEIHALRRLQQSRFTLQDIEAAYNHLKELRDAEKAMQTRAEKLLEDERRALLSAGSEEEDVPDSARKIQIETDTYREKESDVFRALRKAIAPAKADILEEILGRRGSFGGFDAYGGGLGSSDGFGRGGSFAPAQPSGQGGNTPRPAPRPRSPRSDDSLPEGTSPTPLPPKSADEEEQEAVFAVLAQSATQALPTPAQGQDLLTQAPLKPVQGQFISPRTGGITTPQINPRQNPFGRTVQGSPLFGRFSLGMTLPLSDLVDLLQQKRNAMKR